jgi:hypothetical protein
MAAGSIRSVSQEPKLPSSLPTRVARFILKQYTKTGENITNCHKITNWKQNIPNGNNLFSMGTKYAIIYHSKALPNLPKFGFLVKKIYHLANLPPTTPKIYRAPGRIQSDLAAAPRPLRAGCGRTFGSRHLGVNRSYESKKIFVSMHLGRKSGN